MISSVVIRFPEQTVEREAHEECGLLVRSHSVLGRAVEIVHSVDENACFEKRSTFIEAHLVGMASGEHEHELAWLDLIDAVERLTPESHRWAVERLAGCITGR
jgi:8-oxo-dGTP pyrophosphatase MutT (NUDIX family)